MIPFYPSGRFRYSYLLVDDEKINPMDSKMQNEMMDQLGRAVESIPSPDLSHTWAQAPIRLEDALGRFILIPSEYDWDVRFVIL